MRFQFHGKIGGLEVLAGVEVSKEGVAIFCDNPKDAYGNFTLRGRRLSIEPPYLYLFGDEGDVDVLEISELDLKPLGGD